MLRRQFLMGGLAAAAASPSQPREGEAPFSFIRNQIILAVALEGAGLYNFVLDTGTNPSVIDLALARKLRIRLERTRVPGQGIGVGRAFGYRTVIPRLTVGGIDALRLDAIALDLSGPARRLGIQLHGVLGFGFLNRRTVEVDYFLRRIRFQPSPGTEQQDQTSARIAARMQFRSGSVLPVLDDCAVNGERVSLTLDTGSSLGLVLFPQAIRRLGLEKLARQGQVLTVSGYRGQARLSKGWVTSLRLGALDMAAVEVAYVLKGYGESEKFEMRAGSLGNRILQDFVVTLDYANRSVVLKHINY